MLGIVRYIRRHRLMAFALGNPFSQIKIVFGVMEVVEKRALAEEFKLTFVVFDWTDQMSLWSGLATGSVSFS